MTSEKFGRAKANLLSNVRRNSLNFKSCFLVR